jgi:mannose-6-phosphate isomerase-like protein (cupin superfamily)
MKLFALALLTALAATPAGDPDGFRLWKGADLKAAGKRLAPKMNAQKLAAEPLGTFGNHNFQVSHREGNGEAEVHAVVADVFIAQSGEATLIVGGSVVDGKTTAPNEIRGPSIKGGVSKELGAGDIVHIPANTPHQLMVKSGKQFTYFVVKVNQ